MPRLFETRSRDLLAQSKVDKASNGPLHADFMLTIDQSIPGRSIPANFSGLSRC